MVVLTPSVSYSMAHFLGGQDPEAIGVDAHGHVWLVLPVTPEHDLAVKDEQDVAIPKTRFRVVQLMHGEPRLDVNISCPSSCLSSIDALGDQLLVAWSRSDVLPGGNWDHNAWVYNRDGSLDRAMTLGDGIEDLQAASDGVIWTSHFDEGYYSGWEGCASLVAWDRQGQLAFRPADLNWIDSCEDIDCLNVASTQETWLIHLGVLWRLREFTEIKAWDLAGIGSQAFAVEGEDILLAGPWGRAFNMREIAATLLDGASNAERFQAVDELLALSKAQGRAVEWGDERDAASREFGLCWMRLHPDGGTTVQGDFVLRAADGQIIVPSMVFGRGGRLYVQAGDTMHEVALADIAGDRARS